VALSQLRELGEQAVAAVAASLVDGGAVLKAQLIASRFYEALRHELEESSMDDAKLAALTAASDRCERIAAASINSTALLDINSKKQSLYCRLTQTHRHHHQGRGRCCG
jgi:hypothetical protein